MQSDDARRAEFERLCLTGLWFLIRLVAGMRSLRGLARWRDEASAHLNDPNALEPLP